MQSPEKADTGPAFLISRSARFLDAYSLGRLLLCGDSTLNHTLAQHTESFVLPFSSKMQFSWPNLISRLTNLKHVRIGDPLRYYQPFLPDVDIRQLPPTLTSLHLCYANAHISLLAHPSTIDILEINDPKPLPLAQLFPNLQSLKVANAYNAVRLEIRVSRLLRELSTLRLHTLCLCPFTVRHEDIALLPSTLTHLELLPADFEETQMQNCPPLPPHLKALYFTRFPTPAILNSGLPETLQKLHIRAPWSRLNFSTLPQSLTDFTLILEMAPLSQTDFDQFPQSLTRLRMCGFPDPIAVNKFRIARPKLDYQLNGCCRSIDTSHNSQHKVTVQKMQTTVHHEQLKAQLLDGWLGLPKAIKKLFVPMEIERASDVWSEQMRILFTDRETLAPVKFRNGLEEIGAAIFMPGPSVADIIPNNFPSTLTYLSLQTLTGGDPAMLYQSQPILTLEHILALNTAAPQIRHLQLIDNLDISILDQLTIPLETFSGGVIHNLLERHLTDFIWSRNLSELSVFSRSFEKHIPSETEVQDWMEHLPQRMRVLRLVAPIYTGVMGIHLPQSLMMHLPRKLEEFSILVEQMPSPELLSKLPPRLKTLMLRSLKPQIITPEHLVELPTAIQKLHLPFSEKMPDTKWMSAFGRARPELVRMTSDGPPSARTFGLPLVFFSVSTDVMQAAKDPMTLRDLPDMTPKFRPHPIRPLREFPAIPRDMDDEFDAEEALDRNHWETESSDSDAAYYADEPISVGDSSESSYCTVQ